MKILVTGRGKGGSWEIRGNQLGKAIGETVDPLAEDVKGYDLAIVVKRPRPEVIQRFHARGLPIVWDVVDAFPPEALEWERKECLAWLRAAVDWIRPIGIVAATEVMAKDCKKLAPALALPHHARPDQEINPLRETVRVVGYQGGDYLGRWREILERQCRSRGWTFRVDHSKTADMKLADVDIVIAMREQKGYAAQNWKSGVKLANAQGSRTPSVVSREAGYVETSGSRQYFADSEDQLSGAFDVLTSLERRQEQVSKYKPPTLERVARAYLDWLHLL